MTNTKNPLSDLDFVEEVNEQVSKHVSGGVDLNLDASLTDLSKLLVPGLGAKIEEQIKKNFPDVTTGLALACTTTQPNQLNCNASTPEKTVTFTVNT